VTLTVTLNRFGVADFEHETCLGPGGR
jgi:hypothetical protein